MPSPRKHWRDPGRRAILRAYRRAQRRMGVRRAPGQTVQEQAQALPALAGLADLVDVAAYRAEPPSADEVRRAGTR
jgi:hypothetical protein